MICKKSKKEIKLGYCDPCIYDTEERESKMGCEPSLEEDLNNDRI